MIKCTECGANKEITEFGMDRGRTAKKCKQCTTEYNRLYRLNNKDKIAEIARRYNKKKILNETPEQKEARKLDSKLRARNRYTNETPEQKEARLARNRAYRATKRVGETAEEKETRLILRREATAKFIANNKIETKIYMNRFTEEYRAARRRYVAEKRAAETPEQKEIRLSQQREKARAKKLLDDSYNQRLAEKSAKKKLLEEKKALKKLLNDIKKGII